MSAKALGCNQVIVAYLAMENVGVDLAQSIETGEIGPVRRRVARHRG